MPKGTDVGVPGSHALMLNGSSIAVTVFLKGLMCLYFLLPQHCVIQRVIQLTIILSDTAMIRRQHSFELAHNTTRLALWFTLSTRRDRFDARLVNVG